MWFHDKDGQLETKHLEGKESHTEMVKEIQGNLSGTSTDRLPHLKLL